MSRSDSRPKPARGYGFHPAVAPAPRRVSRSPPSLCRRAPSPHTPGGPMRARARCFRIGRRLQHLRKSGHRQWVHEAESGSLALGLASSLASLVSDLPRGSPPRDRSASRPWLPADAGPKLHGERAIHMTDTSQSAREMSVTGTPKIRRRGSHCGWRACASRTTDSGVRRRRPPAGNQAVRESQIQAALDHELFVSAILELPDARSAWRRDAHDSFGSSDLRFFALSRGSCSSTVNYVGVSLDFA